MLLSLGILTLGIAGNFGILIGAISMIVGFLIVILAILLRCIDASAGWGEYKVFHFGKKG